MGGVGRDRHPRKMCKQRVLLCGMSSKEVMYHILKSHLVVCHNDNTASIVTAIPTLLLMA